MLKIDNKSSEFTSYICQPETINELEEIINDRMSKYGPNCDLNDIDTSLITDMSYLFFGLKFNVDISSWDVSNVENMSYMFGYSDFNGDISKWNVSKVKDMSYIFEFSKFNQNISNWKINKNCETYKMFCGCPIKEEYKPDL